MSTHSSIGLVHGDGSVSLNFCHFDGYPSYNGRVLLEFYPTLDKVEKLVALGDLTSLKETVDKCEVNKGEPFFDCANYPDLDTLLDLAHIDQCIEYLYLFVESIGQWFLVTRNSRDLVFLTPSLCQGKPMSKLYFEYDKVRQQRYESQLKFWELVSTLGISEEKQVALEKAFEEHQKLSIELGKLSNKLGHDDD